LTIIASAGTALRAQRWRVKAFPSANVVDGAVAFIQAHAIVNCSSAPADNRST
jgi:hypothetical protein